MKKQCSLLALGVLLVASALILAACGGGSAPSTSAPTAKSATIAPATVAPTTAPATATAAPPTGTPPPTAPAPTDTPAVSGSGPTVSAQSGYDGQWEGKSSTDSPIELTVEQNQITHLTINYAFESGGCSVGGGYAGAPQKASINGKDFTAQATDSDSVVYLITGAFTSSTDASGTVKVKGKGFCGDMDTKATWTAKNTAPAPSSGEAVTPTEVAGVATPTAASSNSDPTNILAMFFLSLDTKNIDDAMSVVSDNVIFDIGSTRGIGKDKLKAYLQDQVNQGAVFVGGNITATGNIVNFSVQVTGGTPATYSHSSIIVQDGKIAMLTLK